MTPRRPSSLPENLQWRAFTVAEAHAAGLIRHRLDADDLNRPYRGVRVAKQIVASSLPAAPSASGPHGLEHLPRAAVNQAELLARAHAYLPLMKPGMAFGHLIGAVIWRLPLPVKLVSGWPEPLTLDVAVRPSLSRPRHRGVRGHVLPADARITQVDGLPVCDVLTVWHMLAAHPAYSDADLVAVGDQLSCRSQLRSDGRAPLASPGEIVTWAEELSGRHCRRMRGIAGLVRDAAQSPMESLTRMLLIDHGLPEPELNVDVHDDRGTFLGRLDMFYRQQRVAPKFDGDQHRTSRVQYERDRERLRDLRAAGIEVIRADVKTLTVPSRAERFVAEVRDALRERSGPGHPAPWRGLR